MSDKKISQLTAVTDVQAGDEYVIVRSGVNYRISGASLSAAFGGSQPPVDFVGTDPDEVVLTVQAAPGQTVDLIDVKDENGNPLFDVDFDGGVHVGVDLRVRSYGGSDGFTVNGAGQTDWQTDSDTTWRKHNTDAVAVISPSNAFHAFGVFNDQSQVGIAVVPNGVVENPADAIQAASALTGNNCFRVLGAGAVVTAQHTAPADGDLQPGECALWFDQTNGAAKLKVKGKSANGTVVAGEVALT